jgi:orotate phosphoribosyltransferase
MSTAINRYEEMSRREVEGMTAAMPPEVIAWAIIKGGAMHIRDIGAGEEAYHYSSGWFGPGYVLLKGAVGNQKLFKFLVRQMALRMAEYYDYDFIAGLVTGGMAPSLVLRDHIQDLQGREIPWVYIRDTRKAGGTKEHVTGIQHLATGGINPEIPLGSHGVVMEELTNFANSLCNGAGVLRNVGYTCDIGWSLLDYTNPKAAEALAEAKLHLDTMITLPELISSAEEVGAFPQRLIDDYRWFQRDPMGWNTHYGYERQEHKK